MVTDSRVEEKYLTGGTIRVSGLRASRVSADEPGILVCLDTLPFSHFSISALTLTYHDARNRRDDSREPTRSRVRSMLNFC